MGNCVSVIIPYDINFSRCCLAVRKTIYKQDIKKNLDALENQWKILIARRDDVQKLVLKCEEKGVKPTDQVQKWLSSVLAIEAEVVDMQNVGSQEIEKLCLGGYCSKDRKSSYQFGEAVLKQLQVVSSLNSEEYSITDEDIPDKAPKDLVDAIPAEPTVGLESKFYEVQKWLVEEKVRMIGLYGMGGIGKTTLLKRFYTMFLYESNAFDVVIWIEVSKDWQPEKIQEKIGKNLDLLSENWNDKSLEEKASEISYVLKKKKFVLLLDDLWEPIELNRLGIPRLSPKIGSKIIFTTRLLDVCASMEADRKFKLLEDAEAWELFQVKVGGDEILKTDPEIAELAKKVVKGCGGLPVAADTIGRAMSGTKLIQERRHAIQMLKKPAIEIAGMRERVYPLFKSSYDNLPGDVYRSCLLYCSLFPKGYKISTRDLINRWRCEGFFEGKVEEQNQGYYIIDALVEACLLEEEEGYVEMHPVIHDAALWIATEIEKEQENYFVCVDAGLAEAPEVGEWAEVRRMSLMENKIENLTHSPVCSHLLTLFLDRNKLENISNDFFKSMPSLKVLCMSYNPSLTQLPSEISNLVSLHYLDLSSTAIRELPKELKALRNLRSLNLENTSELQTIPQQLIPNLLELYVLKIRECGFLSQAAAEDSVSESLIDELVHLESLNILSITLESSNFLRRFLSYPQLQRCTQSLCLRLLPDSRSLKVLLADLKLLEELFIVNCDQLEEVEVDYTGEVPTRGLRGFYSLQIVNIEWCSKLRDLTWLVLAPNLKRLSISTCSSIEDIIKVGKLSEFPEMTSDIVPFAKLKYLKLQDLPKLHGIYWHALPFPYLEVIEVIRCANLKKLPLDSMSARECRIVIKGQKHWWEELQWKDQVTKDTFLPCFRISDGN